MATVARAPAVRHVGFTWCLTGISHPDALEPRMALQMVHESALCLNGIRQKRTLRQKGFETLNGLPFVAADRGIHDLLDRPL